MSARHTSKSPWAIMNLAGKRAVVLDREQQLTMLKRFDAEKLCAVIDSADTCKVARTAARERLAELMRLSKGARA